MAGAVGVVMVIAYRIWSHQAAGYTLAWLVAGCAGGIMWGLLTQPKSLQSILRADEQLALNDLLSTGVLIDRAADDLSVAVVQSANSALSGVSISSVRLRKLGTRMWLAVGLASGLGLSLSAFDRAGAAAAEIPSQTQANTIAEPAMTAADRPLVDLPSGPVSVSLVRPDPEDLKTDRASNGSRSTVAERATPAPTDVPPGSRDHQSSSNGQGGGLSQTADSHAATTPPAAPDEPNATVRASATGDAAAGGGLPAPEDRAVGSEAASGVASVRSRPLAAPWRATGWAADVKAARDAVANGRVPSSYSDLIGAYFR